VGHNPDQPDHLRFIVELEAVADPFYQTNRFHRSGDYRLRVALKALLRGYGLKCRSVRPATPPGANPSDPSGT
jgi:hypothetical protein